MSIPRETQPTRLLRWLCSPRPQRTVGMRLPFFLLVWLLISPAILAQTVTIDPIPRQTLTSFGASGAWWPNDVHLFPDAVQRNLTNFLFSEDGIHLSSYRYNMGADSGNATRAVGVFDRQVSSFLRSDGSYNWTEDEAGINLLKAAASYGVPYITFFINAAPSYIADGVTCGWGFIPNKTQPFAEYIKTVLSYWTDYGIDIKYISPMNEPDYAQQLCGQEGMNIGPEQRSPIVSAIRQALDGSSAENVTVIADESSQLTQAEGTAGGWLNSSLTDISHLAVHNYDFPTDDGVLKYYQTMQNVTNGRAPPVKFTETCCSVSAGNGPGIFASQYDPTIVNALIVARYVWQFLTIAQAVSFDWWNAVANLPCSPSRDGSACATSIQSSGYNSGLVYIDPAYNDTKDYTLWVTKRAWMMKHFATFHRPGSIRYDVPQAQLPTGVNVIASANRDFRSRRIWQAAIPTTWSVLFIHNQTTEQALTLRLPSKRAKMLQFVQTTNSTDWQNVQLPPIQAGAVNITLPAQSLVTVRFSTTALFG